MLFLLQDTSLFDILAVDPDLGIGNPVTYQLVDILYNDQSLQGEVAKSPLV